jgi:hypothetical protein
LEWKIKLPTHWNPAGAVWVWLFAFSKATSPGGTQVAIRVNGHCSSTTVPDLSTDNENEKTITFNAQHAAGNILTDALALNGCPGAQWQLRRDPFHLFSGPHSRRLE